MESTSFVFSFRMMFFYLVTTGWIFDISLLCENAFNQSATIIIIIIIISAHNNKRPILQTKVVYLLYHTFSILSMQLKKQR